jgi:hypothetical protein
LGFDVETIQSFLEKGTIAFKKHTVMRMRQRRISSDEIKIALKNCKRVEEYPDDHPLPSGLVLGYAGKRPIHLVVALDKDEKMVWLITVYEPMLDMWEDGFEKRRQLK